MLVSEGQFSVHRFPGKDEQEIKFRLTESGGKS